MKQPSFAPLSIILHSWQTYGPLQAFDEGLEEARNSMITGLSASPGMRQILLPNTNSVYNVARCSELQAVSNSQPLSMVLMLGLAIIL